MTFFDRTVYFILIYLKKTIGAKGKKYDRFARVLFVKSPARDCNIFMFIRKIVL